jgi:hypothetical protein
MDGASLIIPIGHGLGTFYPGGSDEHVHQVRLGPEVVELDDTDFACWLRAHGMPDPHTGEIRPISAQEADVPALRKIGLLAEVTPGTAAAVDFARTHRLLPLMLGLGNTTGEAGVFALGLLYQPLVLVSAPIFDLWQWAHLAPELWTACREAAGLRREAGVDDPDLTDPERILAALLDTLHTLLAGGVLCLDQRLGRDR